VPLVGEIEPVVLAQPEEERGERVRGAVVDAHGQPADDGGQGGLDHAVGVPGVEHGALSQAPFAEDEPSVPQPDVLGLEGPDVGGVQRRVVVEGEVPVRQVQLAGAQQEVLA